MNRKSMIPPITAKSHSSSRIKSFKTKKTMTYADWNPSSELGQAQTWGRVKPVDEISTLSVLDLKWQYRFAQTIKHLHSYTYTYNPQVYIIS